MTGRVEVALAALLIIGGLTSLVLHFFVFVDPTETADWREGAAWIVERVGPDDVVRIEPFWYEGALVELHAVGDQVQRIRTPIAEDLHRYDNVFILSQSDRSDEALAALPFGATDMEVQRFGSVSALRIAVPEQAIVWELLEELDEVDVSRVRGDEVERCQRWNARERRWDCKKISRWTFVGEAEREVGDDPRRCIWAHPLDRGRTLRLETTVPTSKTIRVRDSFDLRAARKFEGADVLVQVFVDDALEVEDRVAGNDHDWQAHDIDVSDVDRPVRLRIEVDLLGSIKDRFLCLNAWALN